jgi:UDP-N-acetylglucosamine diphosphorylase/glucosamine-1-phosphate N-acetyltransferase
MIIIILAGGKGKRMKSDKPKVLIDIFGKPMLVGLIQRTLNLNPSKILIVTSPDPLIQETVQKYLPENKNIDFVRQDEALGTGHAVKCCLNNLPLDDEKVLILCGDIPFLTSSIMEKLIDETYECGVLTIALDSPKGFGRIVNEDGKFRIVEEKDCNNEQRQIKLVNTGIYCIQSKLIHQFIHRIQNQNSQGEFYFTDIIGLIGENNDIQMIPVKDQEKNLVLGVNTKEELDHLINNMYFPIV